MNQQDRSLETDPEFPEWARKLLRCPVTHEELLTADEPLVLRLQQLQHAVKLFNQLGATCGIKFDGGLVNQSRTYFHPTRNGIQTLISAEAIPIQQLEDLGNQ